MSVLIKNMEMPKNCGECQFCHTENFKQWCCPTGREDIFYDAIPEWCPLEDLNLLCALADRACPFQGKEFAWCLTCPHIGEEDRALMKKAVAEPKQLPKVGEDK